MKLTCLFALFQLSLALDLSALHNLNGPHDRIVTKRGLANDIDVLESNSVPVEDTRAGSIDLSTLGNVPSTKKAKGTKDNSLYATGAAIELDGNNVDDDTGSKSGSNPFLMAISMIVVSEIGDKTFLISALMAMRHSRALVFSASFASLALMTLLSGIVGHTLPTLLSQRVTQFLAAGLFVVFGFKLTKEGLAMSADLGVEEELAEVEEELTVSDMNYELNDVERGRLSSQPPAPRAGQTSVTTQVVDAVIKLLNTLKSLSSNLLSPLWVQVFVMIFLGEWGDRSQIATIAMAAGSNYWAVIMGAVIGHGFCTMAAVIGGKMLASRISMRSVTLGGAFAFFVFAILYFYEALYVDDEA